MKKARYFEFAKVRHISYNTVLDLTNKTVYSGRAITSKRRRGNVPISHQILRDMGIHLRSATVGGC